MTAAANPTPDPVRPLDDEQLGRLMRQVLRGQGVTRQTLMAAAADLRRVFEIERRWDDTGAPLDERLMHVVLAMLAARDRLQTLIGDGDARLILKAGFEWLETHRVEIAECLEVAELNRLDAAGYLLDPPHAGGEAG